MKKIKYMWNEAEPELKRVMLLIAILMLFLVIGGTVAIINSE